MQWGGIVGIRMNCGYYHCSLIVVAEGLETTLYAHTCVIVL